MAAVVIYVLILVFSLPEMIRKKRYRDLAVFGFFMLSSAFILLYFSQNWSFPSPMQLTKGLLEKLGLSWKTIAM